jgi:hypothetical protein
MERTCFSSVGMYLRVYTVWKPRRIYHLPTSVFICLNAFFAVLHTPLRNEVRSAIIGSVYILDDWGSNPSMGKGFSLCLVSKLTLRPTKPPIQWISGVLSLGVKHSRNVTLITSSPSPAEVKNE